MGSTRSVHVVFHQQPPEMIMLKPVFLEICALPIATASLSFACYGLPSPTQHVMRM